MADEVEKLFSAVLRLPVDGINGAVSPDNAPRWDSVSAIDLTLARSLPGADFRPEHAQF
jgi:hypothetical protein